MEDNAKTEALIEAELKRMGGSLPAIVAEEVVARFVKEYKDTFCKENRKDMVIALVRGFS